MYRKAGLLCIDGRYPLKESHLHGTYSPRRIDESDMMRGRRKAYYGLDPQPQILYVKQERYVHAPDVAPRALALQYPTNTDHLAA